MRRRAHRPGLGVAAGVAFVFGTSVLVAEAVSSGAPAGRDGSHAQPAMTHQAD